jgi:hypothetical protein
VTWNDVDADAELKAFVTAAIDAAVANLGGSVRDCSGAMRWLQLNAQETDERGVVEEINFCRDLIDDVSKGSAR